MGIRLRIALGFALLTIVVVSVVSFWAAQSLGFSLDISDLSKLENLRQQLQSIDQEISESVLAVAVETARQVLRQSLRLHPELLLPVIREAIGALPLHHGHPALFLAPDDVSLVRQHLGEQLSHNGWRILEDSSLSRGGCRIESGASEVDATLETRWRRVLEAIGTSADWLDEAP